MKTFREYYLKTIFLVIYFWVLLPFGLSQRSDLIVGVSFLSLGFVVYEIVAEIVKIFRRIKNDKDDDDKNNRRASY